MVRALFVMPNLDGGGAEKVVVELLRDFDRTIIEPSLFLMIERGPYLESVPPDVNLTWGVEGRQLVRHNPPRFLTRLLAAASRSDVVVGGLELLPSYFAWLAAAITRKPIVGWVHTDPGPYFQSQPLWSRTLASLLYPRFDRVVVLTVRGIDSLRECARVERERIHVIPNYVDTAGVVQLSREPEPPWIARVARKPFFAGVGRLCNHDKGLDVLVRAHALLRRRGIDHNLVILGEGPDRKSLQRLTGELSVESSVFLPGFHRNPFPVLKSAVALLVGARLEGFGLALVEAMALGVPVIASSKSSGPVTILEGGKHGVLVGADDVDGFATAMGEFLTCPARREDYSRRAILRSRIYSVKTTKQWESLLSAFDQTAKMLAAGESH